MSVFSNWLKKKAKDKETIEVQFEPLPIKMLIEITDSKLQALDKHAGSRRMRKSEDSRAEGKLLKAAAYQMSVAHYLKELVLLKAASK